MASGLVGLAAAAAAAAADLVLLIVFHLLSSSSTIGAGADVGAWLLSALFVFLLLLHLPLLRVSVLPRDCNN